MADVGLTKEQVIAVCGALADPALTSGEWAVVLEITSARLNPGFNGWGNVRRANIAGRYLAAHIALKMLAAKTTGGASGGAAGPLVGVTVGRVSKTFAGPSTSSSGGSASDDDLRTTAPGRQYLALRAVWPGRVAAV